MRLALNIIAMFAVAFGAIWLAMEMGGSAYPHEAMPTAAQRSFQPVRAVPAAMRPGAPDGLSAYVWRVHDAPKGWTYPFACCSGQDCREVKKEAVEEGPGGYRIRNTGELLPYADSRVKDSPDGEFHWCSVAGKDDGRTICLFVPPRAF